MFAVGSYIYVFAFPVGARGNFAGSHGNSILSPWVPALPNLVENVENRRNCIQLPWVPMGSQCSHGSPWAFPRRETEKVRGNRR